MDTEALLEQVQETLKSIFRRGSRYQAEKLGVVSAYLVLVLLSVVWGVSGGRQDNALGAAFGLQKISGLEREVYFLENHSDEDWTQVRAVLNQRYLFKKAEVKARQRLTLGPHDFDYFYYIPRPWGLRDWERLAQAPRPERRAPTTLTPKLIQVRAREGSLSIDLDSARAAP